MTKFILVGGYIQKAADGGRSFFIELVRDVVKSDPVTVLDCLFAARPDKWEQKASEDQALFDAFIPERSIKVELARSEDFMEQLEVADVLYIRGGNMQNLFDELARHKGWEMKVVGKSVAGTSAGAYALSAYYFMQRLPGMVGKGFGLVPVKTIVHYRAPDYPHNIDWDLGDKVMSEYAPELPTVALKEGEFCVFHT